MRVGKLLAAASAAALLSCGSNLPCEPGTICSNGLICVAGECAPCRDGIDDRICGAPAFVCLDGRCKPAGCDEDRHCTHAPKLFCDQPTRTCVDCSQAAPGACGPGKLCIDQVCKTAECATTLQCPEGKVCKAYQCVACDDPSDDPLCKERGANQICASGVCQEGCRGKQDCLAPLVCIDQECTTCHDALDVFEADELCSEDGIDRLCQAGVCVPGECRTHNDCGYDLPGCGSDLYCHPCTDSEFDLAEEEDEICPTSCDDEDNCVDYICDELAGPTQGQCVPGCHEHADCLYLSEPKCAARTCGPCDPVADNADVDKMAEICGAYGFFCGTSGDELGTCAKGCLSHADCAAADKRKCDPVTHKCGPCNDATDNTLEARIAICGGLQYFCRGGLCVEGCDTDDDCTGLDRPVCRGGQCGPCTPVTHDSLCDARTDGYICVGFTDADTVGECTPGECHVNADCNKYLGARPVCGADHYCASCPANPCAAGQVCVNGTCVTGNCLEDTDCNATTKPWLCQNNTCGPCTDREHDDRCNARYRTTGGAYWICKSSACQVGCRNNGQCPGGKVCLNDSCQPCQNKAQCGSGQVCEGGVCKNGECLEDTDCPLLATKPDCKSDRYCGPCTDDPAGDTLCNARKAGTLCIGGGCKPGCRNNDPCLPGGNYCNLDTHQCEPCTEDVQCGPGRVCKKDEHKCVVGECDADGDCKTASKPFCELPLGSPGYQCVPCTDVAPPDDDKRCGSGKICERTGASAGACRPGCRENKQCPSPQVCRKLSLTCGPCTDDPADCDPKHCKNPSTSSAVCVDCIIDAHCPGDNVVCNTTTNKCQGCVTNADCPEGVCDKDTCVECATDDDCERADPFYPYCEQSECWDCRPLSTNVRTQECVDEDPGYPVCLSHGPGMGECVPCETDLQCAPEKCVDGSCGCRENADCPLGNCNDDHECELCYDDAECNGFYCYLARNACVECLKPEHCDRDNGDGCRDDHTCGDCSNDAHCGNGYVCDGNSNRCVKGCRTHDDCTADMLGDRQGGVCYKETSAATYGACQRMCGEAWLYQAYGDVQGPLALSSSEDVVYALDSEGVLHAIEAGSGNRKWSSASTGRRRQGSLKDGGKLAVYPDPKSAAIIGIANGPAVDSDGKIFVAGADGVVYRFNATGSNADDPDVFHDTADDADLKNFLKASLEFTSPVIINTGTPRVVIGTASGYVLAIAKATGDLIWSWRPDAAERTGVFTPAIFSVAAQPDGRVHVIAVHTSGYNYFRLRSFPENGKYSDPASWTMAYVGYAPNATRDFLLPRGASVAISKESGAYFVWTAVDSGKEIGGKSLFRKFAAATGTEKVRQAITACTGAHNHTHGGPAVDASGNVYLTHQCDGAGKLLFFDKDGTKRFDLGGEWTLSTPAVGADGMVYVLSGMHDDQWEALKQDDSILRKPKFHAFTSGGAVCAVDLPQTAYGAHSSPVIGENGLVFFGDGSGGVHAVYTRSPGHSPGGWPHKGGNPQNSGTPSP